MDEQNTTPTSSDLNADSVITPEQKPTITTDNKLVESETSTPATAVGASNKAKMLLIVGGLAALVLIPLALFILGSRNDDPIPDSFPVSNPTNTPTVEPTSETSTTPTPSPTTEISEYSTYRDNFITFEYPKDWKATVKSGNVVEKECTATGQSPLTEGVKSINLKSGSDLEMNISYLPCPLDGGPYAYYYDKDFPKTLKGHNINPKPEDIQLAKAPFYQMVDQLDAYFFIFPGSVDLSYTSQYNSWGNKLSGNQYKPTDIWLSLEDGGTKFLSLKDFDFVGPTDQSQVEIVASILDVKCEVETKIKADSCFDMLTHFFDTARRVN